MDTIEYKVKINDPCAFRKNVLEESLRVLKSYKALEAYVIEKALSDGGIEKPDKHESKEGFDYYWVKCTSEEADAIASYLFDAEAMAVPDSGETTPEASRYGVLVDTWTNFRNWIERGGNV
jgi:hypothetical protein